MKKMKGKKEGNAGGVSTERDVLHKMGSCL
jgi:hypothetical protein